MKAKKILLPFLSFNLAFNASICSMAQSNDTEQKASMNIEKTADKSIPSVPSASGLISAASDKAWGEFTSSLRNAKLSHTFNAPTSSISKGLSLSGGYSLGSNSSIAGKYSGVDVWSVNIGASPELFGLMNPSDVSTGAMMTRQFTFIQQFDDRISSFIRLPYDPITKIPIKSDLFFKTKYNKATNQNEPIIKDGDFIAFRAPLTLSIGSGKNFGLNSHTSLDINLFWILAGEFDIHIFKMKDNQVRVKIMAIKDNTRGGTLGLNLMGFNPLGKLLISRAIDTNLAQFNYSTTQSDLFISDYIFNLNKAESRDMYDDLIGHKMKSFDMNALSAQLKTANPFAKDSTTKAHLVGDLDRLNVAAKFDQTLPITERRISLVSNGKNETDSSTRGLSINLFKFIKGAQQETQSISRATIHAQDDHDIKKKYILETLTKKNSYQWFWLWAENDSVTQSLLLKTDDQFKPVNLLGFQFGRTKEDKSMSSREYSDLQNMFNSILPTSVSTHIEWPEWDFGKKDSVQNAYVQQDLLFTENLFKLNIQVDFQKVKTELNHILKSYGKFKSLPMGLQQQSEDRQIDPRMTAFQRGDYLNAFSQDWEQLVIPSKLTEVFDSKRTADERYKAYQYLNQNVPVFSEINNLLLLRLVPENLLSQVIVAKLSISAKNQPALESYYPSKDIYNKSNIFREITYQTQYILNRSFDLRNFLKEDGSIYSTEEILTQKTDK